MNIFCFTVLVAATAGGRAAAARPCQFQSFKDPANGCVCDSFTVPLDKTRNKAQDNSFVMEFAMCSQWPGAYSANSPAFVQVQYVAQDGSGSPIHYTEDTAPAPVFLAQNSWTNSAGQKRYCPDLKGNWAHTLDTKAITFNTKTNQFDYDFKRMCSHVDGPGYPASAASGSSIIAGAQRAAWASGWCKNLWLSSVFAVTTNHSKPEDPTSSMSTGWYGPFAPSWMECPMNVAPCDAQDSDCVCSVPGLKVTYQCNPTTGPPTCAVKGITSMEECGNACEKSFYDEVGALGPTKSYSWSFGPDKCAYQSGEKPDEKIICQEPVPSASSPSSASSPGLSIGVEIAIVAASLVAVAGLLLLYHRRQQRREERGNDFHSLNVDL